MRGQRSNTESDNKRVPPRGWCSRAEHGAALPLPMVSGKRGRGSAKAKGVKRPLEEGEDKEGDPTLVRKRKPRHTGLLARDGPLLVA